MGLWWPHAIANELASYPWDTWFWAPLPRPASWDYWAWGWPGYSPIAPVTYYWFRKISPSGGHQQQLAIKSPVGRVTETFQSYDYRGYPVKANVIYICCYVNDSPNWAGATSSLVQVSPPCSNWVSKLYEVPEAADRSQTYGMNAAIQGDREKAAKIKAAIAKDFDLPAGIQAAIQGNPELDVGIQAAIQADRTLEYPIRAAIRAERILEPSIIAAVAQDVDLPAGITAAIQGNPQKNYFMKAAIRGDAQLSVGIKAFVVKSRVNKILLDMENSVASRMRSQKHSEPPEQSQGLPKSSLGT